jgi:hypothetical protein
MGRDPVDDERSVRDLPGGPQEVGDAPGFALRHGLKLVASVGRVTESCQACWLMASGWRNPKVRLSLAGSSMSSPSAMASARLYRSPAKCVV